MNSRSLNLHDTYPDLETIFSAPLTPKRDFVNCLWISDRHSPHDHLGHHHY